MTHPDFIGTDPRIQRQLFVLGVSDVDELRTGFRLSDEPFVCLLVWDSGMASEESVQAVASLFAGASCREVCIFGDDRQRLHACISDALAVRESPRSEVSGSPNAVSGDSLDHCLTTFLQSSAVDPEGRTDCHYGIAILIGRDPDRLRYVRGALSDHVAVGHGAALRQEDGRRRESTPGISEDPGPIPPASSSGGLQTGGAVAGSLPLEDASGIEWKHSRFGIASFTLTVVLGLCLLLAFGLIGLEYAETGPDLEEDSPLLVLVGLLFVFSCLGNVLSLALGVVGLLEKRRKKAFALLGTVLSSLTLLLIVVLTLASILME